MTVLDDTTAPAPQTPDGLPDPSVRPAHLNLDPVDGAEAAGRFEPPGIVELVAVVAVTVGVSLTVVPWGRIFADNGHVASIVVSAIAGSTLAVVLAALRRPLSTSFAIALGTLVAGLVVRYNTGVSDLPGDLVDSWKALASTGLLIPTSRAFTLPPIVVTGLAAWAASTVVVRRSPSIVVAFPVLGATVVALAYTVSVGELSPWYPAALVASIGVALLAGGVRKPGGTELTADAPIPGRQLAVGIVVLSVLSVSAGVASSAFGGIGDNAFDLRDELGRPLDIYESATPLASVKSGLVADIPNEVFTIRLEGLPDDTEVRLIPVATLDSYDGSVWSTTAQFEPAGSVLPVPEQSVGAGPGAISQTVELESAYPFRFLPRAGTVRGLEGDDLAWDPRSGTVASVAVGATGYVGSIDLPAPRPEQLSDPGTVPGSLRYASLRPETNEAQTEIFQAYASSVVTPDQSLDARLAAFEENLQSDAFGYNEEAPAGHSLAALVSYLQPDPDPESAVAVAARIGFSEQSSSVFALLARQMGLASRVVVGYRLDDPLTAGAPEQTVDEGQIYAWPEVWFDGIGWVGFDPTNRANRADDLSARTPAVSSEGQDSAQGQLPDLQEPVLLPPEDLDAGLSPLWWLLLIPVIPALYGLLVVGAKRLRRARRRRSAAPDRRVMGAWHETRDRFGELGLPAARTASALDVAEQFEVIDLRDIAVVVGDLAPVLDEAFYAPAPVSDAQATHAWDLSKQAISAARKNATVKERLTAALDPRPLFH